MGSEKDNFYLHSKIYKLQDNINFYFYIGCTCNSLQKRKSAHKARAKKEPTRKVYAYFNKIGWENVSIISIEQKELQTKEQLLTLEDKYILENKDNPLFLNTLREPIENIEEHKKLLHNENKLYRSLRFSCPCGSYLPGKKFFNKHRKSCKLVEDALRFRLQALNNAS